MLSALFFTPLILSTLFDLYSTRIAGRMFSKLPSHLERAGKHLRPLIEERRKMVEELGDDWTDKPVSRSTLQFDPPCSQQTDMEPDYAERFPDVADGSGPGRRAHRSQLGKENSVDELRGDSYFLHRE